MSRTRSPNVLGLILLIIILGTFVVYVPVNPSLTVAFSIQPNSTGIPIVAISTWAYGKQSLASSANIRKGQIVLTGFTNSTNPSQYALIISVNYNNQTLSVTPYIVGQGLYQARVVYWPRTEQSNTPYTVVVVAKSSSMQNYSGTSVNIFPTT